MSVKCERCSINECENMFDMIWMWNMNWINELNERVMRDENNWNWKWMNDNEVEWMNTSNRIINNAELPSS